MLTQESKLYQHLPVAEKYAILETMRLELDRLYREDRPTYDRYRPVHTAFKHRGGVANAINIKSHFYGHL